ncbi:MAG: hypothetical protein H6Q13_3234 [Bacteroidetes bacterium]|nr:hypothetical protein [Bacteroidota bacterium]
MKINGFYCHFTKNITTFGQTFNEESQYIICGIVAKIPKKKILLGIQNIIWSIKYYLCNINTRHKNPKTIKHYYYEHKKN